MGANSGFPATDNSPDKICRIIQNISSKADPDSRMNTDQGSVVPNASGQNSNNPNTP